VPHSVVTLVADAALAHDLASKNVVLYYPDVPK